MCACDEQREEQFEDKIQSIANSIQKSSFLQKKTFFSLLSFSTSSLLAIFVKINQMNEWINEYDIKFAYFECWLFTFCLFRSGLNKTYCSIQRSIWMMHCWKVFQFDELAFSTLRSIFYSPKKFKKRFYLNIRNTHPHHHLQCSLVFSLQDFFLTLLRGAIKSQVKLTENLSCCVSLFFNIEKCLWTKAQRM